MHIRKFSLKVFEEMTEGDTSHRWDNDWSWNVWSGSIDLQTLFWNLSWITRYTVEPWAQIWHPCSMHWPKVQEGFWWENYYCTIQRNNFPSRRHIYSFNIVLTHLVRRKLHAIHTHQLILYFANSYQCVTVWILLIMMKYIHIF